MALARLQPTQDQPTEAMAEPPDFNADFRDMVEALQQAGAAFVVVGAHALAAHGIPRATGDFDILVQPTPENAARVIAAFQQFGAPIDAHHLSQADLSTPGLVYQIGLPPRRIDILTAIDGVDFATAYAGRLEVQLEGVTVPVLGRAELIANKRATDRAKDRLDLELLHAAGGTQPDQ
jgi:hypothetical protein